MILKIQNGGYREEMDEIQERYKKTSKVLVILLKKRW